MRFREFSLFENKRQVLDEATVADMIKAYDTVFAGYKINRRPIVIRDHFFQRMSERSGSLSQDQLYQLFAIIKNEDLITKAIPISQTHNGPLPTALIRIKYKYLQSGGNEKVNIAELLVKYYQDRVMFDTLYIQDSETKETRFEVPVYNYKQTVDLSNSDPSEMYGQSATDIGRQIHNIGAPLKPIVGHVNMSVTDIMKRGIDQVLLGRNMEIQKRDNAAPRDRHHHQKVIDNYDTVLNDIARRGTSGKLLEVSKDRFDKIDKINVLPWNNNATTIRIFMSAFPKLFPNMSNQYDIDNNGILRLKQRNNIINRQDSAVQKYQTPEYYHTISEKSLNAILTILQKTEESIYDFESPDQLDGATGLRLEKLISDVQLEKDLIINNENGKQTDLINKIENIINSYNGNTDTQKSALFGGLGRKIGALETYNNGQTGLDAYARYLAAVKTVNKGS